MADDPRFWSYIPEPLPSIEYQIPGSNHSIVQETELVELGQWSSRASGIFSPLSPPHIHESTDELLPQEYSPNTPSQRVSSNVEGQNKTKELTGWRLGVAASIAVASATLILNISVTAWASTMFGLKGGIGTIHVGPCAPIKHIGLWIHIAINVLSTLLLGASNYCMQCLCSPTRSEVDKAHSESTWLDIGIQSMRNLGKIKKTRAWLWILLSFSSIPLHLMFNSAVFVSLTANEYVVAAVSEDFVNGANWTLKNSDPFHQNLLLDIQKNISAYDRLDQHQCIREYGVDYLSSRRHTLAVVLARPPNPLIGVLDWKYVSSQNSWVCGTSVNDIMQLETLSIDDFDCSINVALANDTWHIGGQLMDYCLSEKVPDQCRLQFAEPIMVAVICCNFVKLICMILTLWMCQDTTFVTLGDALGDFLGRTDLRTAGMCTATKNDFVDGHWPDQEPKRWSVKKHFHLEAVGIQRWCLTNIICAVAVISLSVGLSYAIHETTTASDIATLWNLGFGTVTSSSLVRWNVPMFGSPGLIKNVLLANSPQLILSLLYIVYNRMYTCMSFSSEWHAFSRRRRALRVTSPRGDQRSTYFLSLPYKYLVPILITSVATHWILSQSFFLVAIDVFDEDGNLSSDESILTCGFSCIAIIFLIGIGYLVLIIGVGTGFRRYEGGMPLVGSCSAAMSAACHTENEEGVALVPVKWGVISISNSIGHCTLSGRYVSPPITGRFYAGNMRIKEEKSN